MNIPKELATAGNPIGQTEDFGLKRPGIASSPISFETATLEGSLQAALDIANMGAWGWDAEASAKLWPAQTKAIFGLRPEVEMTRELFVSMLHPDDVPRYRAAWAAANDPNGDRIYDLSYRIRRASDGVERWIHSKARVEFANEGPMRALGALRDITEEQAAVLRLRESEATSAHLAAIVASCIDAIISKSVDGIIMSWNAGAARLFGYFAEEMVGQPIARMIPPELIEGENQILARIRLGERISEYETQRLAKDGQRIDVSLTISAVRDATGNIIGASKIARDITERKRAERQLAEGEARFRAAQEASLDAFLIYEPIKNEARGIVDLKVVYANSKAAAFFHLHPQVVEGKLLGDLLPQTKRSGGLIAQLGRIYQTGRPEEFVLDYDADGAMNYFQNSIAPFGPYIATTFRNITEQVEGTMALAAAKAEAERANLAKSKFLAAASHDLRQPVQSLTLLMDVMKRQAKDRPKIMELADMAQASVSSLNGMLTGILDVSKLDAGVIAPAMASTDIGELVERLALEYRPRAAVNGLELRYLARRLRSNTDGSLLERIVRNLIENALRYTSKGGVLVGVRQRGEFVRLDVIGTGIGIPADQQVEIFDEFRQLNNPARDSSKGLGLGLAIVARLARLLGTEVEVTSRIGRGTRFSLLLPLDRTKAAFIEIHQPLVDPGGRIFIIEDNAEVRQAYEFMLSDWGYETISLASGEDALDRAACENWRFDAILADYRLGAGLTGTGAATEIARRANRAFPTLILTGDTAKERIAEIQASGFVMLHKPVEADDLRRALAELLEESIRSLSGTVP